MAGLAVLVGAGKLRGQPAVHHRLADRTTEARAGLAKWCEGVQATGVHQHTKVKVIERCGPKAEFLSWLMTFF